MAFRSYVERSPAKAARMAAADRESGDPTRVARAELLERELAAAHRCRECGRALKDPISVERGIGPECWRDQQAGGSDA